MTASEQIYLDRLRAIRSPQTSGGGKKGGGILGALLGGMVGGAGGAVNPMADQGPLPDGGNLGQPGLTPTFTGGEGKHFLTLGNPDREQIKLGRFFKPRVNQEAAAMLAADPLAPVQPEQETKGFGGFVRRMFGDNANERNAALAEQQGKLRLQKWLMDQQNQGRMGLIDKEHQLSMERLKAQIEADNARQANSDQSALQRVRLQDQNALGQEGMRAVNDLIGKSQDQSFRARQAALDRGVTERGQDLTSEAQQLRAILSQREGRNNDIIPSGGMRLGDKIYLPDDEGIMREFTGGVPAQGGGLDPAALANVAAKFQAVDKQNAISAASQPPTVLGGAVEAIKDVPKMYNQAAMGLAKDAISSPLMQQMTAPLTAGYNQFVAPKLDLLKQYQLLKNKQKLQQLGVTNSPSLTLP